MEIEDTPQGFKTEWLNETLRFIKNDQELVYKYPEWPISRVTFYHALIAQRQLNAGLGFKTLYAPLWEAMRVFDLKYTFKAVIINSKDEEKGHLVLEKIPIKSEEDNETDSEEESTCKHKLTKKMEQAYLLNKAIVERNSPTFIKNTLQSLLSFILDEASASIDFKGLAPIEAKFIQNIQSIHEQKCLFYKIFTPSAIEVLKKISSSLKLCNNTFKIKVGNVLTHPKTAKREITLTKEPNFGNPSTPLPSTASTSPTQKKSKLKPNATAPLRPPKGLNSKPTPLIVECVNHDVPKPKSKEIDEEKKEKQQTSKETVENTRRRAKSQLINVDDVSNNENSKENSLSNSNKTENKIDHKVNDNKVHKNLGSLENDGKSVLPEGDVKVEEKDVGKTKGKSPAPENNSSSKPSLTRSGQKRAMMEAMSKPLESDKGLRMMKLMGWEGGALGLRGDGLVEPIMPALHLKPKAGLGAPPAKISTNENKKEPKTKKATKETKTTLMRLQFLEGVQEALDKGSSVVNFPKSLNTKEVNFYINSIVGLNRRLRVTHNCVKEKTMVNKIMEKLSKVPDNSFEYRFMKNDSQLCLRVVSKTDSASVPEPTPKPAPKAGGDELPERLLDIDNYLRSERGKPARKKETISKLSVKLYTLMMVADFVESDDSDVYLDFSFGYCKKVYKYMQRICDVLNEGKQTNKIKSVEEVEMLNEISVALKSSFLSVHLLSPRVHVRKLILSSKHRKLIDYNQIFNISPNDKANEENGASDSETDENKAKNKIDDSKQKLIMEPGKAKKLNVTINSNSNKNAKQLKNQDIETNQYQMTENKFNDMDEKIVEKGKESGGPESQNEKTSSETFDINDRDIVDLTEDDSDDKDVNDNVIHSDIPSEIKTSQRCDTNSLKDNIDGELQKDSIDVLEYKENNILKIVVQDWKNLENLSGKIQENIMNCDCFLEDNYLKCHGIQNGGLVYYCSNVDWLKNILSKYFNANFSIETVEKLVMKVQINSFIKVGDVLKALGLHNRELCTSEWTVLEEGNCYFVVDVDCDSFQFLCDHRFTVFAGIDTALFTVVL